MPDSGVLVGSWRPNTLIWKVIGQDKQANPKLVAHAFV